MLKEGFFTELQKGKRDRSAPRRRYKDQLKRQLAQAGIGHQSWQQEASDRDSRRSSVRKANRKFEAERHEVAKERRRRQKERAASQSSSAQTFACTKCRRVCASRIRLLLTNEHARTDHQLSQNLRLRGISQHHHHRRLLTKYENEEGKVNTLSNLERASISGRAVFCFFFTP